MPQTTLFFAVTRGENSGLARHTDLFVSDVATYVVTANLHRTKKSKDGREW